MGISGWNEMKPYKNSGKQCSSDSDCYPAYDTKLSTHAIATTPYEKSKRCCMFIGLQTLATGTVAKYAI